MEPLLIILPILSFVAYIMVPLLIASLVFLAIALVYAIIKKKFFLLKYALILFGIVVVIMIIEIALSYNIATSIIKGAE